MRRIGAIGAWGAWITTPKLRRTLTANAHRLIGAGATKSACRRYGQGVIRRHYQFIVDVAAARHRTLRDFDREIESVEGDDAFFAAAAAAKTTGNGIVVVTAHLGSFEVGVAALRRHVEDVSVVFKRDPFPGFESARQKLHAILGVKETPIDDGFEGWVRIRDTLERGGTVLLQADRAMPGQRSVDVPFLGGTIRLPSGPFRLAEMTGATVLPVFAPRTESGGVAIIIGAPIPVARGASETAVQVFARVIEDIVRRYRDQWLCMHPILLEDQADVPDPAIPSP